MAMSNFKTCISHVYIHNIRVLGGCNVWGRERDDIRHLRFQNYEKLRTQACASSITQGRNNINTKSKTHITGILRGGVWVSKDKEHTYHCVQNVLSWGRRLAHHHAHARAQTTHYHIINNLNNTQCLWTAEVLVRARRPRYARLIKQRSITRMLFLPPIFTTKK